MATTSAIPLILDRLLELMEDNRNLDGVECVDGLGRRDEPLTVIALGDVRPGDWSREWAGMPARQIKETFSLQFWIRVREPDMSPKEARDRAFELLGYLDEMFIDQVTLRNQIDPVLWISLRPNAFIIFPSGKGHQAYIAGNIDCSTQIQPKD